MDSSIGPYLPIGPFEKPSEGSNSTKRDDYSENLHKTAHAFSLELIKSRNSHSKTLQRLGVIMFVAESGVLPRDMSKQSNESLEKIRENFYYSSMKEREITDELDQIIERIKTCRPQAKIIAIIEELFYLLVKNPIQASSALDLQEFNHLIAPIEEKVFNPHTSDLHARHIAKRMSQIQEDCIHHPQNTNHNAIDQLKKLSQEVQKLF